jgi:hypothetical protein
MEGFIKVIPRKSYNLKNYFFYLTFNNRSILNVKNETPNEIDNKFYNNNIKIEYDKGNLNFYFSYMKSLNNEFIKNQYKTQEVIMSYSKEFNDIMIKIYTIKVWKKIYMNIINLMMEKYFENNKHFYSFFHETDSTGIRIHNHTLLYPYSYNESSKLYELDIFIKEEKLNLMKKEFNEIAQNLILKNKTKYKKLKKIYKTTKKKKDKK